MSFRLGKIQKVFLVLPERFRRRREGVDLLKEILRDLEYRAPEVEDSGVFIREPEPLNRRLLKQPQTNSARSEERLSELDYTVAVALKESVDDGNESLGELSF